MTNSLKRYLLFVGDKYYPSGGMKDFKGDFDSLNEAQRIFRSKKEEYCYRSGYSWYHILDQETRKICSGSDSKGTSI